MDKEQWYKILGKEHKEINSVKDMITEAKLKTYYNKDNNLCSKIGGQEVWWSLGVEKGKNKVSVYGEDIKGNEYEGVAEVEFGDQIKGKDDNYTIIKYKKL